MSCEYMIYISFQNIMVNQLWASTLWRVGVRTSRTCRGRTACRCFRQKFLSIFMVTYLPTILMNIINQATNYLSGDSKYDLVITVNITSMMVLASIYLSVSTSLPSTPNIKPVEIWLLTNLAYPFLVILVNIVLQASV